MTAEEARKLAEYHKKQILEDIARTIKFENNVYKIHNTIKQSCELGGLSCSVCVDNETKEMIEALTYYFASKMYNVKKNSVLDSTYLDIEW